MSTSKLVAFLSAAPDAQRVRAALDPERFDTADVEGDEDSQASWTLWLEVNGMKVRFTSEAPPALHEWHFEQPRWSAAEREAAKAALFALRIETDLEEPPLRAFREQVAIARAAAGSELLALFDESAERLLAAKTVEKLAAEVAPKDIFSIHSVGPADSESFWVHTHGLARARVPELDLLGVPREGREAAAELLDATAALLLSHGVPPRAAAFPVGEGVSVALLPLDEALARAPAKIPGARDTRGEEHREKDRLVLAPAEARSGGSPVVTTLLPRVSRAVLFRSPEDTERMRHVARERWDDFVRLFRAHGHEKGWGFVVKLGYEPDRTRDRSETVTREHLWFRVKTIEDGRVEAVLESKPTDIAALKFGETRWHELARLTDWLVFSPEGEISPR